jgi:uncharacterized protein involved in outer membrane biogenesis
VHVAAPRIRRRRLVGIALASLGAILLLIIGGIAISLLTIDPDSLKPRIAAAVKRATGRELFLNGPIHLTLSMPPSIEVSDVSFANPPGFSRPMMATLQRLDLQLALLPLLWHRIEIGHLELVGADVLLETNAAGETNWAFPQRRRTAPEDETTHARLSIADAELDRGRLAYRDARSGRTLTLGVTQLSLQAASFDAPLHLAMQASANGAAFSLAGEVGPLSRLRDHYAGTLWPIKLQVTTGAAALTIDGGIGELAKGRLYALQLTGSAPDIAPLAAFLPGLRLPPLHDASLRARMTDTGRHIELEASAQLAGTSFAISGAVDDLLQLTGVDLTLRVDAPDLSVFSGLLDRPLPPLQSVVFHSQLKETAGSVVEGVALRDISMTSKQADIHGDAVLIFSPRPSLTARLTGERIDADALRATGSTAAGASARSVISDRSLPFGLLRLADANLNLTVNRLLSHHVEYQSLAAQVTLRDGQLLVSPFTMELPEGRLTGTLSADATQPSPRVALALRAPDLAVQPLLTALGLPEEVSGKLQVSLDLQGNGTTPRSIVSGLNGRLGMVMAGGTVSNWLLANTAGWVLREADMPGLATEIGTSDLHCFGLRMDFNHGAGELHTLLLDSSPLYLDGRGTVRLANETLDLHLRPEPMLGGVGLYTPLHVTGTFAHPNVAAEPMAAAQENAIMLVDVVDWIAAPFSWIAEKLGIVTRPLDGGNACIGALLQDGSTEATAQPMATIRLLR